MKKKALTREDIQRELLSNLKKRRPITIFLTVFLLIAAIFYILYVVNYSELGKLNFVGSTDAIITVPFIILLIAFFLFAYYYSPLYIIKTEKFKITEDKLCQKERELILYYRRAEKENSLYFLRGRIAVDDEVYSYSNIGDVFYLVIINNKKAPSLVYNTRAYEIR